MMKQFLGLSLVLLSANYVHAQFAPQVGNVGTTAIHMDSSVWVNWANNCSLQRGWQNIADTTLGKAIVGDDSYVPGKAGNGVVSLGDGGFATVTFEHPIVNGAGYDFAVFENGFIDQTLAPGTAFLELAFVEVSSDGENFVRFKATSLTETLQQTGAFKGMFANNINNLAGKYLGQYGTPFDLEELKDEPNLDVNNITHVRIVDVVGSIQNTFASRDAQGNKINDPWPTPFASSGFDLDAVGVIHQNMNLSLSEKMNSTRVTIFPNPVAENQDIHVSFQQTAATHLLVYDMLGNSINTHNTRTADGMMIQLPKAGIYHLLLANGEETISKRITVR
jgi:hypothetical protein